MSHHISPSQSGETQERERKVVGIVSPSGRKGGDTPYGTQTPIEDLKLKTPPVGRPAWGVGWTVKEIMRRRSLVAVSAFFGFANLYAMRANLSVAILEMQKKKVVAHADSTNFTLEMAEFATWSPFVRGLVLGSFFWGYIVTQLPGGWLAARYGGREVYGLGVLGTALLTLLTPPLAHMGKEMLIMTRVAEGLCQGVAYPAIHAIWSNWAPPAEKTTLAMIAFSGSYFGTVVAMPLSAWLGENFGWPSIFYIFGLLGLLWCCFWFKTVANSPSEDSYISQEELAYIERSIGYTKQQGDTHGKVPWGSVVRSLPVWAIIAAHFCENWGFYTMLTHLPLFMADVMRYNDLKETGLAAALPYLLMGVLVICAGELADVLRFRKNLPTGQVRKFFCCGAFLAQAVFTIMAAHSGAHQMALFSVTLAVGLGGFAWSGFGANHLDLAPQHASVLMGISNTVATLPGIISPPLVGWITSNHSLWEWRIVSYISVAIYLFGTVFFWLFSSGERQSWAEIEGGYMSKLDDIHEKMEGGSE